MSDFRKPYAGGTKGGRPQFNRNTSGRTGRPGRSGAREGGYQKAVRMFDAVCSNCGKPCQVPFRPDGQKPVYCKDCFDAPRSAHPSLKRNSSASPERARPAGGEKSIADLTRQIAAMNAKIDTMLKILEEGA